MSRASFNQAWDGEDLVNKRKGEKMIRVKANLSGHAQQVPLKVDCEQGLIEKDGQKRSISEVSWNPPIAGTVYGVLLNYRGKWAEWEDRLHEAPYNEPPRAPILFMKPSNTVTGCNEPIPLPTGESSLQMGASLAIVIGRTATRVQAKDAFDYIEGYTIANDVSIPHTSIHRPAIAEKARDGFCPVGPWVVAKEAVTDPSNLQVRVYINDQLKQENNTRNLLRGIPQLIEDVTEFMTLHKGDLLLVGKPENAPLARAGDRVRIEISHVGVLENSIVAEERLVERGQVK